MLFWNPNLCDIGWWLGPAWDDDFWWWNEGGWEMVWGCQQGIIVIAGMDTVHISQILPLILLSWIGAWVKVGQQGVKCFCRVGVQMKTLLQILVAIDKYSENLVQEGWEWLSAWCYCWVRGREFRWESQYLLYTLVEIDRIDLKTLENCPGW